MHSHVTRVDGRWSVPASVLGSWGVRRASNGAIQVIWSCERCDYVSSPIPDYVSRAAGIEIAQLPIVIDYAGQFGRCIVRGCESDDVELNHFGPRAIFGAEAENWPMGYLCRRHHREWGERVTPQLNRRGAA
ncbi:MAG TPA: hypothetical protein VFJ93_07725 [Gaiellaceae bacterium]|nr:hypothetical protein [Gaiellaceae bacterium]